MSTTATHTQRWVKIGESLWKLNTRLDLDRARRLMAERQQSRSDGDPEDKPCKKT